MNRSGNSRLLVVDHDCLAGLVTLKDMLSFLSIKLEFEEAEDIDLRDTAVLADELPARQPR
jgi:hypothetical protein